MFITNQRNPRSYSDPRFVAALRARSISPVSFATNLGSRAISPPPTAPVVPIVVPSVAATPPTSAVAVAVAVAKPPRPPPRVLAGYIPDDARAAAPLYSESPTPTPPPSPTKAPPVQYGRGKWQRTVTIREDVHPPQPSTAERVRELQAEVNEGGAPTVAAFKRMAAAAAVNPIRDGEFPMGRIVKLRDGTSRWCETVNLTTVRTPELDRFWQHYRIHRAELRKLGFTLQQRASISIPQWRVCHWSDPTLEATAADDEAENDEHEEPSSE